MIKYIVNVEVKKYLLVFWNCNEGIIMTSFGLEMKSMR